MTTEFILVMLYFISTLTLVLVFVARGSGVDVEINGQDTEESSLQKSDVDEIASYGL
jgi:hypothetical protein